MDIKVLVYLFLFSSIVPMFFKYTGIVGIIFRLIVCYGSPLAYVVMLNSIDSVYMRVLISVWFISIIIVTLDYWHIFSGHRAKP